MNVNRLIKIVARGVKSNAPKAMIGIGISGMFVAAITAVRDTPKATSLIENAKKEKGEELTKTEILKTTWKVYAPAVAISAISTGLIVAGTIRESRKHAALVAAYGILENTAREYHDKVVSVIGKEKDDEIHDEIAKEKVKRIPCEEKRVFKTGNGEELVMDSFTGRYFTSSIDSIKQAILDLNYAMLSENTVSLNEFYYDIGLDGVKLGDMLCWCSDRGPIEARFTAQLTDDGRSCIVMGFKDLPKPEYMYV